jgi:hypothetical protein
MKNVKARNAESTEKHAEPGEKLLCHVRGMDEAHGHIKRFSSVTSVFLRGLRVSRFGRLKQS